MIRDGHTFEAKVIEALRNLQCDVRTSEELDRQQKVDGEIRRLGSKKLQKPVQIQLTLRIDHYGKLDAYLFTRKQYKNVVSLYVEVHPGPSVREIAEHLVWATREVQTLPPYGHLPIFGLRIDDDAAFYDPHARLRELREERKSPARLAALITGTVYRYDEKGFWIMDGALNAYHAHYVDADSVLRPMLREKELQLPVRFLPTGPSRATDVRFIHPQQRRALGL